MGGKRATRQDHCVLAPYFAFQNSRSLRRAYYQAEPLDNSAIYQDHCMYMYTINVYVDLCRKDHQSESTVIIQKTPECHLRFAKSRRNLIGFSSCLLTKQGLD